jgi:hypothetical protein
MIFVCLSISITYVNLFWLVTQPLESLQSKWQPTKPAAAEEGAKMAFGLNKCRCSKYLSKFSWKFPPRRQMIVDG